MENMILLFKEFNITRYCLEDLCGGKKFDDFTDDDFMRCKKAYQMLKTGQITPEQLLEGIYPKAEQEQAKPPQTTDTEGK
jgi:hypothetical protein